MTERLKAVEAAKQVISLGIPAMPDTTHQIACALLAEVAARDENIAACIVQTMRAETAEAKLLTLVGSSNRIVELETRLAAILEDGNEYAIVCHWKHRVEQAEELVAAKDKALNGALSYLHWRTDDLCGDDCVGDGRLTLRFKQRVSEIEKAIALKADK